MNNPVPRVPRPPSSSTRPLGSCTAALYAVPDEQKARVNTILVGVLQLLWRLPRASEERAEIVLDAVPAFLDRCTSFLDGSDSSPL